MTSKREKFDMRACTTLSLPFKGTVNFIALVTRPHKSLKTASESVVNTSALRINHQPNDGNKKSENLIGRRPVNNYSNTDARLVRASYEFFTCAALTE
ncbi:hypothetical protein EVAR_39513_1 [Eumeta japonica]|uniref:Uncharacterized protein n=1 Tax=Eumeta variegata TaxID=151549 RepID=A0A4C1W1S4_EUMVA|nr:hypothetical protein EVAR_39513_1 [Eumeta japonica]